MDWSIVDGPPIWKQLTKQLTDAIATGEYPSGAHIPPVRELALQAGVNPNTMQRALAQLECDGLIVINRTAGRVVTEDVVLLEVLRNTLAEDAVTRYMSQMGALGFTAKTAARFLTEREASI